MTYTPEQFAVDPEDGSTPWNSTLLEEYEKEKAMQVPSGDVEGLNGFSDHFREEVGHVREELRKVEDAIARSVEVKRRFGEFLGALTLRMHGEDLNDLYRTQTHLREQLTRLEEHHRETTHQ